MDTPAAKATWNANYGVVSSGDRRLAFSRQLSSNSATPRLARSDSSIAMPMPPLYQAPKPSKKLLRLATASRPMRRLALLLALNVAYSATELAIGLFTGRVGTNERTNSIRRWFLITYCYIISGALVLQAWFQMLSTSPLDAAC
jgi:zinc transporter 5/7